MVELEQEQDFIGREALREIAKRGVTRKLVGVELGGAQLGAYSDGSMPDFFPVTKDGALIGKVTSACFSPRLEKKSATRWSPSSTASSVAADGRTP